MKYRSLIVTFLSLVILTGNSLAQDSNDKAIGSITAAELRDHIFFLASDYLQGRVATTPEYEIAAQYVAAQFAAAGLEPAIKTDDGSMSYFQGVPFAKTVYNDKLAWSVNNNGTTKDFVHKEDFKIRMGNNLNHDNLEMVWLGYGIEDPDNKWNDFEGLDVTGKIMVIMSGAPTKKGKPVLPQEIHDRFYGRRALQTKLRSLYNKGAAGIIMVDLDDVSGSQFDEMRSSFTTVRTAYKGNQRSSRSGSFPSIYVAKPAFLNVILADNKANPLLHPDNILKNYKPQLLEGVTFKSEVELISEEIVPSNNVVGMVAGTDPVLKNEIIVVGAHLDHVRPQQGQVCNGADDNASGSSGVMEIAEAVAMNPCKRTVVFITYTAEEMGLIGSRYFVSSDAYAKEQLKFNINMDMIGRSGTNNEESRAHYVVTNKRYLHELEAFITDINQGVTDFPLIFDDDEHSPGGSDHQSFIGENIPAFFFFSGVHKDLHRPTDDADKIDYAKAERICKLGYLMTEQLGNMETVPDFLEK